MDSRTVRSIAVVLAAAALPALAQVGGGGVNPPQPGAAAQAAQAAQSSAALPPQNYGTQPGFFRNAPEMATFEQGNGVLPSATPVSAAPVAAPAPAAPAIAAPNSNVSVTVAAPPQRIPDPTQNLQWAEHQADRVEAAATAAHQAAVAQQAAAAARTPPPVAPGAYNGQTDPATR
jgi:hypothetical protein